MVDVASISRRASRVSSIFNVLATVVLVVGVIAAVGVLVATFAAGDADGVVLGVLYAVGIGIYVVLVWAGIQLSSVISGYIHVRTQNQASTEEV